MFREIPMKCVALWVVYSAQPSKKEKKKSGSKQVGGHPSQSVDVIRLLRRRRLPPPPVDKHADAVLFGRLCVAGPGFCCY